MITYREMSEERRAMSDAQLAQQQDDYKAAAMARMAQYDALPRDMRDYLKGKS